MLTVLLVISVYSIAGGLGRVEGHLSSLVANDNYFISEASDFDTSD